MRLWILLALLVAPRHALAQDESPPHVLLILADDLSWHDLGFAGGANVATPRLDALRAQGMYLRQASCMTAMCAPARTQLYTGLGPVRSGAFPNHSAVREGVRGLPQVMQPLGYRTALIGKRHVRPRASFDFDAVPEAGLQIERLALGLRGFFAEAGDAPWFLVVASREPHLPWEAGVELRPAAEDIEVPAYLADTPATRTALASYYGEVAYLDAQVGICVDELRRAGLEQDTMLVFLSEQGAGVPFAKWTCYEAGLRASAIVRWPGRVEAGSSSDALIQYVDFLPTWVEAAGGEPSTDWDGRSFLEVLLGRRDEHRAYAYGVQTTRGIVAGSDAYAIRSVRDARWKLIHNLHSEAAFQNLITERDDGGYFGEWRASEGRAAQRAAHYQHRPPLELYDLAQDPYELRNLAQDPAHEAVRARLQAELERWMRSQGDRGDATERAARARGDD